MARRLPKFNFSPKKEKKESIIDKVLDGNIWKLEKEEDFPNKEVHSFKRSLAIFAGKKQMTLQARILDENCIVVQAIPKEENVSS